MAHYVIGDVQGCFDELQLLLKKIDFNYGCDTLWLTGDIVNRGPKSLATIRFVMLHDDCIQTVLGNHDLHLLAVAFGEGRVRKGDTIDDILQAIDKKILLDWLRRQPLMIRKDKYLLDFLSLSFTSFSIASKSTPTRPLMSIGWFSSTRKL